jgi:hypothetical protein
MSPDSHDFNVLQNRIENLEKQNRGLKRLGAVALISVTLLLVMGQAPLKRRVEANEFVLNDDSGKARAKLSMDVNGTPRMAFLDSEGRTILELNGGRAGLFGGAVGINNEQGGRVGAFFADESGGHFWVSNREGGGSRADVGPSYVEIADEEGFRAELGTVSLVTQKTGETHRTTAASLILFDKNKNTIWRAP